MSVMNCTVCGENVDTDFDGGDFSLDGKSYKCAVCLEKEGGEE